MTALAIDPQTKATLTPAWAKTQAIMTKHHTSSTQLTPPMAEVKILLVDDDVAALDELHDIVEFEGWEPVLAKNVSDAMKLLKAYNDIRVVVTDVHFTDPSGDVSNGIQLVSRAQAQFAARELAYIVLSGDPDAMKAASQEGAFDFLSKPLEPDALVSAINSALEGAEEGANAAYVKNILVDRVQSRTSTMLDKGRASGAGNGGRL